MNFAKRYETIDIAKAIAIILVAIGHFEMKPEPDFYRSLRTIIYTFHMPLFMFASGFLCVATWKPQSYQNFIFKKFRRLMIPYFVTSIIIIAIKLVTASVLPVDNPVAPIDFITMLWLPKAGYFLWFVYALWWMMMIYPIFNTKRRRILLFLLSIPIYMLHNCFPHIFCFNEAARMVVYFAAGTVCFDLLSTVFIKKLCGVCTGIYPILAAIAVCSIFDRESISGRIFVLITAFAGIGFSIVVSYIINKYSLKGIKEILYKIAGTSYIIYLFHTTFMGFAKGIISKSHFLSSGDLFVNYTIAEILVSIIAGVLIPYLLCRYVLARFALSRDLFGLRLTSK